MNLIKKPLVVLMTVVLCGLTGLAATQSQSTALERGYRTGYSDGYSSGAGDVANKVAPDYQNKEEYKRADRSFNDVWGPIDDYRDGYQQGFEAGYTAGYEQRDFNSSIPTGLKRRPASASTSTNPPANVGVTTTPDAVPSTDNSDNTAAQSQTGSQAGSQTSSFGIPKDTVLYLELLTPLSTDATQRNDPFRARVTGPNPYADYIVEGRVSQVKRPGKVKGVAELQLTFEQIRSPDNRTASFRAELVEVMPLNSDSPTDVDSEGGVKGRDSTKDDAAKIGAASGIGAIIGVITGGGKGSAIGAIIGAGAGTAGVMTQRGKDIRLERGQPMKIRTATDTSVL